MSPVCLTCTYAAQKLLFLSLLSFFPSRFLRFSSLHLLLSHVANFFLLFSASCPLFRFVSFARIARHFTRLFIAVSFSDYDNSELTSYASTNMRNEIKRPIRDTESTNFVLRTMRIEALNSEYLYSYRNKRARRANTHSASFPISIPLWLPYLLPFLLTLSLSLSILRCSFPRSLPPSSASLGSFTL